MPSSKHSSHQWGDWSEWTYHPTHGRNYRVRQNTKGEYDYEWDLTPTQTVPRSQSTDDGVDAITQGMNFSINNDTEDQQGEEEYTTDADAEGRSKGKHKSSKSKSRRHERDSRDGHYDTSYAQPQIGTGSYGQSHIGTIAEQYEYNQVEDTQATANIGSPYHHDSGYPYAESSTAAYGLANSLDPTTQYYAADTTQYQNSGILDSKYNVEHSSRFRAGEIFKVYWSEPKGAKRMPSMSGRQEQTNNLGELVHTGFRRFIVIANDQGHCTCVPILTYENKACTKNGVKPDKHGIIHDERKRPQLLHREPELGFRAIRAIMTETVETLAKESRVNYSKPSTIEHNSLVWFVGRVHPDDFHIVLKAYNKCWAKKDSRHKKS